jgi:short subunit dehydrogenase-like uncharacterized protein
VTRRTHSHQRAYDVVLYGATGFVGQQTVAYFAQRARGITWAIAGRNRDKLEAVLRQCKIRVPIIEADAHDTRALQQLALQTRVVLSTAGPFALYGSELLAACVMHRTHYVDITGETPWVRTMIDDYHALAAQGGTRIVPGCGFDSVPSDLGAYVVAREMQHRYGQPCASVKACFTLRGGLNGGTLASALHILAKGQKKLVAQPFLLNPADTAAQNIAAHADPVLPIRDKDFNSWLGPFFMGPINTRVVRRSAALWQGVGDAAYGRDFHYQEYLRFGSGVAAASAATAISAVSAATGTALRFWPLRKMASMLAPQPGEGPSESRMDGGSFRCDLIGTSASGHQVRATISDQGDPGNRATTKMVCEAALALAMDVELLPGDTTRGGVLTPAFALGDVLVQCLRDAGMKIEILRAKSAKIPMNSGVSSY